MTAASFQQLSAIREGVPAFILRFTFPLSLKHVSAVDSASEPCL